MVWNDSNLDLECSTDPNRNNPSTRTSSADRIAGPPGRQYPARARADRQHQDGPKKSVCRAQPVGTMMVHEIKARPASEFDAKLMKGCMTGAYGRDDARFQLLGQERSSETEQRSAGQITPAQTRQRVASPVW